MKKVLKNKIETLEISNEIIEILKTNNINYLYELCILNRKILKQYNLNQAMINQVIIKLELLGLDLGKKYKI